MRPRLLPDSVEALSCLLYSIAGVIWGLTAAVVLFGSYLMLQLQGAL